MATVQIINPHLYTKGSGNIRFPNGKTLPAIVFGNESRARFGREEGEICHDCRVKPGEQHHAGCDVEECPQCHLQLISCGCLDVTYEQWFELIHTSEHSMTRMAIFDEIFTAKQIAMIDEALRVMVPEAFDTIIPRAIIERCERCGQHNKFDHHAFCHHCAITILKSIPTLLRTV